jgi:predicted GNAT superfamily acetyltransferase
MGVDLIEWTFDPLQALNAHVNFAKLGVVARTYELNVYGASSSPLHRGSPTDRFVAEWWLQRLHVQRRIAPHAGASPRAREVFDAPLVNRTRQAGEWLECATIESGLNGPRLFVEIPPDFGDMMERNPDLALDWRMKTRQVFTTCFARGYRVVDFLFDRHTRNGRYLLALEEPEV